ncbi:putative sulfate exporter family transporter [Arsenicitalea aurantiaca]|uniref:Putative sulfate exporter family transporter n=1 Tax=Arsenicitalea aurantiaca TaxID=1783274 RepID=A0A433XLW0_9HYPH|nr:putative sulfate exporter family transporter [Arsenicitalea aurantiaca]RUT35043.1 putative sulfate exporter family transporter [Arsenicitalea aurantiaca]
MASGENGTGRRPVIPSSLKALAPGLFLALTVAAAANFVASAYGGPVMLMALLIGIALNFTATSEKTRQGLAFASRTVLQVGVALLGLRISVEQVVGLGAETLALVIGGVLASIGAGVVLARFNGRSRAFGILAGGATGICGASAALAISSALPPSEQRERETAFVIVAVTTLSTLAMVLNPVLAHGLGFDDRMTGIFLGATIHDVAQVVGAGYAVSDEAGDTATVVKLFRVALLLPTILVISMVVARRRPEGGRATLPVPLFVIAFAVLVAFNSAGWVPAVAQAPLGEIARWCLVIAVAAIGIRTSIPDMLAMGRSALAVPVGATLLLLVLVVGVLLLG